MSTVLAGFKRMDDHFHPADEEDPAAQRRRRGALEAMDYAAYAANRQVIAGALGGRLDKMQVQALAVSAAQARAEWVAAALRNPRGREAIDRLAELRRAFEELREAYEGCRRMVERGYLSLEG